MISTKEPENKKQNEKDMKAQQQDLLNNSKALSDHNSKISANTNNKPNFTLENLINQPSTTNTNQQQQKPKQPQHFWDEEDSNSSNKDLSIKDNKDNKAAQVNNAAKKSNLFGSQINNPLEANKNQGNHILQSQKTTNPNPNPNQNKGKV